MSSGDETPGVTRVYMEFVKHSCTLTELLEIANVSRTNKSALVELAKDICIGIDSIHELGILHNDIKCTKILVKRSCRTQPSPKAIFIDFGLASELDGITMSLDNRSRYPQYAPELFVGEHSSVRSDIFSKGYVLCLINEIVGSTLLGKISKACRLKNPAGRPNMGQILKGIDTVLVSEFVT